MKISDIEVSLIDQMGSDLSVVNAARVSFAKESEWEVSADELAVSVKDAKLITYLAEHNHWTPFAHAFLSFRIKAPIFVARQLVKHQVGLAWNEESRRYIDSEPEFYWPYVWRGKPKNAKQGSDGVSEYMSKLQWNGREDGLSDDETSEDLILRSLNQTVMWYKEMIQNGVAPEQARMILPQNTMTEWVWSGSLAAFARVCNLRLDPHAQKETRDVALKIQNLVPTTFRHSWHALVKQN